MHGVPVNSRAEPIPSQVEHLVMRFFLNPPPYALKLFDQEFVGLVRVYPEKSHFMRFFTLQTSKGAWFIGLLTA